MTTAGYHLGTPGFSEARESSEVDVLWGNPEANQAFYKSVIIDSTAVGSGTPTTILLPGQIMAELDAGGWVDYDAEASDGSQHAKGVLVEEVNLLDPATAAAADRHARVMISGPVKVNNLVDLDYQARAQLKAAGFIFDDDQWGGHGTPFSRVVPKAASYTVTAADNGALFTTTGGTGAITFTLPTAALGLSYTFLNTVDQNMVIDGNSSIVGDNSLTLDTITFSTASHKIGACVRVYCVDVAGTAKWMHEILSPSAIVVAYA